MDLVACTLCALLSTSAAPAAPRGGDVWTQAELEAVSAAIREDVEEIRGLEFKRPVTVKLADRESFIAYAKARLDRTETPESIRADELLSKMLGLVPADMDLLAKTLEVLEGQVGGFYDPGSDTFYLMETFTGGIAHVILAHELTHALDDQYHDIDGGLEKLEGNDDQLLAYQAVIEGSGTAVMNKWLFANLDKLDRSDFASLSKMGMEELSDAPAAIWKPMLAVYQRGEAFLKRTEKMSMKGVEAEDIESAFKHVPASTEQILHPDKYWNAEDRDMPRPVRFDSRRTTDGGWKILNETTLGELMLALFTASDKDRGGLDLSNPLNAMKIRFTNEAAKGWGGDRCLLLEREKALVLHMDTRWDTPLDAAQFAGTAADRAESLVEHLKQLHVLRGGDGSSEDYGIRMHLGPAEDQVRLTTWVGLDGEGLEQVLGALSSTEDAGGDAATR